MKEYDSNQINIVIGAISIESGRAMGPFLRIENESEYFGDDIGADGEVVRFAKHDYRATATIIIMASSESNQALSALATADIVAPNGAGIVPFLVTDGNGDTVYEAKDCWVQKPPPVEYGQEPGTREWTIRLAHLIRNDAGM